MDRLAIDQYGLSGQELMQRAGQAAFDLLAERWPSARSLKVVCGTGNNGGDGWVIARLALQAGWRVEALLLGEPERIGGDAALAYRAFIEQGGRCDSTLPEAGASQWNADVLVDALCGTGVSAQLRPPHIEWVNAMNASGLPILAIDAPSGLNVDTGIPRPVAVKASVTATFIAAKQGLFTGSAGEYVGRHHLDHLSLPESILASQPPCGHLSDWDYLKRLLPTRTAAHHKGLSGHVLVIGGNTGYAGAAILAAQAALRSGAGLVSVATQRETARAAVTRQPEIMARPVTDRQELNDMLRVADSVVIGPGLGQDRWAQMCLSAVLERSVTTVFDADALNLLSREGSAGLESRRHVLTPHPGEAARLLGVSTREVAEDRFLAVRQLAEKWNAVCILKGFGTLIGEQGKAVRVCPHGNPGMACGGMGDVLAGMLGALLAQGMQLAEATETAVVAHAVAGDLAARQGQHGMLPSDVISEIRGVVSRHPHSQ